MKHVRIWMMAVLAAVSSTALAETTVTWLPPAGTTLPSPISVDENITLTWEEGGGDQAPRNSNGVVSFLNGNRVKIEGAEGVTITKIAFSITNKDGDYGGLVTCDASGKNESSTDITSDRTNNICIWTGEAASVIFRAAKQTGIRKISAINITYSKAGGDIVPDVFDLAVTAIEGGIDLAEEDNTLSVTVRNKGNQDIADAVVTINAGDLVLGTANVSVTVDGEVTCTVPVSTEGLTEGDLEVTATVTVTDDDTPDDNTATQTVTVTPAPVPDVFDLAVTAIEGGIDLAEEENTLSVTVRNKGNQDIADAVVTITAGELVLGTANVSVTVDGVVTCTVPVSTEGLTEGDLEVTANVTVADDDTPDDNTATQTVTVTPAPVPDVFDLAVTAIEGGIDLAEEDNSLSVTVRNKGNQDIADAVVTITAGELVLGTANVSVTVGDEVTCTVPVSTEGLTEGDLEVTATVTVADDDTPDDNTATKTVTVTPAPVPDVFDLAVTAIEGGIDLAEEENSLSVTVRNKGNQDIADAVVTITAGELVLGTANVSVTVGNEVTCTVPVSTEGLTDGNLEVTATVTVADDDTPDDNTATQTVTVTPAPVPVPTAIAAARTGRDASTVAYTLDGKKVRAMRQGQLYLMGGKKVFVKAK